MIEVYNYPLSPCGEKVRFALAEKGLTWLDRLIDLENKENLTPAFLKLSPKGLVPVLVFDGEAFTESTVINEFIDDQWPVPALKPESARERAVMRQWTKLVDEVLHPAWPGIAWPILVRPAWLVKPTGDVQNMLDSLLDTRRRERQERLYRLGLSAPDARSSLAVFEDACDRMERQLKTTRWLAGSTFSLADLGLFPYCFAADIFGLRALFASGRPQLAAWYNQICARPAYGGDPRSLFDLRRLEQVNACAKDAIKELGCLDSSG